MKIAGNPKKPRRGSFWLDIRMNFFEIQAESDAYSALSSAAAAAAASFSSSAFFFAAAL